MLRARDPDAWEGVSPLGQAGKLPSLPDTPLCYNSSLYSASEKKNTNLNTSSKTQAESQILLCLKPLIQT